VLLADAVTLYLDDRRARGEIGPGSAKQLGWRLGLLTRTCPQLPVAGLDRQHVLDWQRTVGGYRPASRRAYLSTVHVFCGWAVDAGLLAADPTVRLAKVREPRPSPRQLSEAALNRLELVLPDERARLIVGLGRHGLRCVEIHRLKTADYDPGGTIRVSGKGGVDRTVPVLPWLAVMLDRATVGRPAATPMVGLSAARISDLVSGWMGAAGLKAGRYDGISAHALRHTAAARMLEGCDNVNTVKTFLGHKSLATTTRYLPDTPTETMRQAMVAGGL
jgi:integrase